VQLLVNLLKTRFTMIKRYSVAIYPSLQVIDFIKELKGALKNKIDWYSSCNSVAHVTICEFEMEELELGKIKQKIFKICDTFTPFQVYFDHFDFYENSGAFFIAPTEESKNALLPVMKKVQENLKSLKLKKSDDPHISIGRKLTPENIKTATELFTTIKINFFCSEIVLRELEPHKQFSVIDTFKFGSNPQPELIQGSLF